MEDAAFLYGGLAPAADTENRDMDAKGSELKPDIQSPADESTDMQEEQLARMEPVIKVAAE